MAGAVVDYGSLTDIGALGGALAVIRTSDAEPVPTIDEQRGSVGSDSFPFVVTRYPVTIEQLVIWPSSVPEPHVGDELNLDIDGGTAECHWLEIFDSISLLPNSQYLIVAAVAPGGRWILAGGNQAYSVANGWITSSKANATTAIVPLLGTETSTLPPLTIVPSLI